MKLSSLLPQMACALLLMASCSQEDSMTPGESPSSVSGIRITTQVSDVATRGITETATLQNFGICIQGSGEHASSLQYNNVEMTKNGEEWTSATPMLWQSEIPSADIIAYAPYQADISDALATQKQFPVSVKAVQTQEDLSSDLLVFKAKDYAPTIVGENKDKIVEVKFDHAFSQLMVTFNFDSAFSNDEVDLSKIEDVKVEGTVLSGVCDFSQDKPLVTVQADAAAEAITPENVSFQAKDAEHCQHLCPILLSAGSADHPGSQPASEGFLPIGRYHLFMEGECRYHPGAGQVLYPFAQHQEDRSCSRRND